MHIANCQHPSLVLNKWTEQHILSGCGDCSTCCNVRAKDWINRLQLEAQHWKYCFMIYLSYDNENVPRLGFSDDFESLVFLNRENRSVSDHAADPILLSDLEPYFHNPDYTWRKPDMMLLSNRLRHPLGLPVPFPRDLQDFNKRFNKYCFKHITNKYENFRFFHCIELGPRTHRPHVHGLFFFNADGIADNFGRILSSSWSLGYSDSSSVYSSKGYGYVAQYLNRPTHLPAFYQHKRLRQRHLFSRCPSLGSVAFTTAEIRSFYHRLPLTRTIFDRENNKFVDLPVQQSFKDRFFPKLSGYSELSRDDRVELCGLCEKVGCETFDSFRRSLRDFQNYSEIGIAYTWQLNAWYYYLDLKRKCKDDKSFVVALYRWYSISKRLSYYRSILGVSLGWIVDCIDRFYQKLDYENLKMMYRYESDYSLSHPVQDLIHIYPEFVNTALLFDSPDYKIPDWVDLACKSFGLKYWNDDGTFDGLSEFQRYEWTYDFEIRKVQHDKIYNDSHKRMMSNDYIEGKTGNIDPSLIPIFLTWHKANKFK